MDLRDPNTWISHLLENLPDDKLACALKDDDPDWEYIDGEMLKLGSLAHSQLDIPEIQRRGLVILASESKDFRLLAHLLRTLQHAGDPLLALRLLALYVEHYWTVAAPQNAAHKQRFATQVLKRFETGVESFAETARTAQRDSLLAELAKLAQRWQEQNIPALAQAVDDLSSQYRRAFRGAAPVPPAAGPSTHPAPVSATPSAPVSPSAPAATTAPPVDIDSHDDKAWRDTLLKVAAILCERQPDSPQGYRLRRHALWQAITSVPQAESDGRTPLAASPGSQTAPMVRTSEDTEAVRQCFSEQGLEAALRYLETLPEGDPRDRFHRQYLGAQLLEEAGMAQLAQQQYRMLFKAGLRMTLAEWEPSLLEQLENKLTAEQ